jgi:hypothetical protein
MLIGLTGDADLVNDRWLLSWGSALVRLAADKHIVVKVRKSHQC